ncbi:TetR family transcriptional regulator [Pseudonocardia sp. GCM10023141]|uniref:TetR family transcriptional regulator n=1 Tax=Pseudonocardia sp. GCM10023141 TaxID=3252653 RepID=UPI003618D3C0
MAEPAARTGPRRAPRPGERKRDPERTKQAILDAAAGEFARKGYAGARTADIAAAAGVNQQLIAYYFNGKAGLAKEIGRRWRAQETVLRPGAGSLQDDVREQVMALAQDPAMYQGAKLLAWEGLESQGLESRGDPDPEEEAERAARLGEEVARIRRQQEAGELDPALDPAAVLLIMMSAGMAPAVYPQLVRALFGRAADTADFLEHYAEQLARVIALLAPAGPGRENS